MSNNIETADQAAEFQRLYEIVVRLRSPGGCPWDIEQTPISLRDNLIEETYEFLEALDEKDMDHIKEELGDIILLATMIAYMHEQEGHFSVGDVLEGLCEKLIRRHPHVFAGEELVPASSSEEALENWSRMKVEKEGRKPKDSILDTVSRGLPPLDRAFQLQKKAAKAGFDWPDADGVIAKTLEELEEVKAAMGSTASSSSALEEELGDLLFSVVNLCRYFGTEPSLLLQRTNNKFTERFKYVEKCMKENGQDMKAENLNVMEEYWNKTKKV